MIRVIIFITLVLFLAACTGNGDRARSEEQAIQQLNAPFSPAAIRLNISADPEMNSWNHHANSCTLLIVQSEKVSSLNALISDKVLLRTLFNGSGTMNDILRVDRYAAMPAQQTTLHIDRNENVRYVAIIAGYYPFPKKQDIALYAIPLETTHSGFWNKKWHAELTTLAVNISLGAQSTSFSGSSKQPVAPDQNNINDANP